MDTGQFIFSHKSGRHEAAPDDADEDVQSRERVCKDQDTGDLQTCTNPGQGSPGLDIQPACYGHDDDDTQGSGWMTLCSSHQTTLFCNVDTRFTPRTN